MATLGIREDDYPAKTRNASGVVGGTATEVSCTKFSDKILVTISQQGRLSQWVRSAPLVETIPLVANNGQVQVPLTSSAAGSVEMTLPGVNHGLLPSTHLTPSTLLGGGGEERETLGQLYAAQLASFLTMRDPEDRRTLVLGMGLVTVDTQREAFFDLFELAQKVL
jgi:proteasome assembly chaperone 3